MTRKIKYIFLILGLIADVVESEHHAIEEEGVNGGVEFVKVDFLAQDLHPVGEHVAQHEYWETREQVDLAYDRQGPVADP